MREKVTRTDGSCCFRNTHHRRLTLGGPLWERLECVLLSDGHMGRGFLVEDTACASALGAGGCLVLLFTQGSEERPRFLHYGADWDRCRRCVCCFQAQREADWVVFVGMPWKNSLWLVFGRGEENQEDPLLLMS